jgi:hypothetical protein
LGVSYGFGGAEKVLQQFIFPGIGALCPEDREDTCQKEKPQHFFKCTNLVPSLFGSFVP